MLKTILLRLQEYVSNPDPMAKAAGTVAIVVAGNQPFYPLYLHAIAGIAAWPAWLTLLSTPFFVAVPAVARRHSLTGRALLPIAGVANTMLCVKLFGVASAVELFLFPCILLAAILIPTCGASCNGVRSLNAVHCLHGSRLEFGPSVHVFSIDEYKSIIAVHAASVATLTAFIGLLFAASCPSAECVRLSGCQEMAREINVHKSGLVNRQARAPFARRCDPRSVERETQRRPNVKSCRCATATAYRGFCTAPSVARWLGLLAAQSSSRASCFLSGALVRFCHHKRAQKPIGMAKAEGN